MPSLFISYRRSDSPDTVKLIYERLKKRLPRWEIFYDHESIPLGDQFPERLAENAHDVWAYRKLADGWTWDPAVDTAGKNTRIWCLTTS